MTFANTCWLTLFSFNKKVIDDLRDKRKTGLAVVYILNVILVCCKTDCSFGNMQFRKH